MMRSGEITSGAQVRIYWLIYLDSALCLQVQNKTIRMANPIMLEQNNLGSKGIQSVLEDFYSGWDLPAIGKIDLCFLNSIFHKTSQGKLECFMNHRPGFLYYHQSFFEVPVTYGHIAQRLTDLMTSWLDRHPTANIWFHLRHETLYILFASKNNPVSISAFEVRKALDVHYYILFHIKTLKPLMGGKISQIVISGELLEMDQLYNFMEDNIPGVELRVLSDILGTQGKWDNAYAAFLPEVNF